MNGHEIKAKSFLGMKINAENIVLCIFVFLAIFISLFPVNYGFFRDEIYYIALSKHLAWGYVDVPPLMPFCIAIVRFLFGESVFVMHMIAAIFGAIILVLTREIVKKLGGNLYAQTLALLSLLMSSAFVARLSYITYDCFDCLFWVLCLYCLVLLISSENKKYWLYLGVFAGLGLMSKFGILWLMFGIFLAMFFTRERRYFYTWQFWVGGFIALLIVSPYLFWIIQHQFLTFEYLRNYSQSTATLTFFDFFLDQIKAENPFALLIWVLGLYYFLFDSIGKKFRLFGLAYIFIALLCIVQQAKFYMITPIYPVLFAGGAVFFEKIAKKITVLYKIGFFYAVLIVILGVVIMPAVRPIFPVDLTIRYLNYTNLFHSGEKMVTEKYNLGLLPQHFADCFGWEEMTAQIAKIYYNLSEKERAKTVIVAGNYGEASGIYFYSEKYKLPMPISQHLQYYVWGYQNMDENGTAIIVGANKITDLDNCKVVEKVGQTYNKYAVPYENKPIYLCRGLKKPIEQVWLEGKNMHM